MWSGFIIAQKSTVLKISIQNPGSNPDMWIETKHCNKWSRLVNLPLNNNRI